MKRNELVELAAYSKINKDYDTLKQCTQAIGTSDGVEKSREGYAPINAEVDTKVLELQGVSLADKLASYQNGESSEA